MLRKPLITASLLLVPASAIAQERVDLSVIHQIKAEEFQHSKVMETMYYLTDVHGPRLTNSSNYWAAGEWAVKRLQEYGLSNVHLEKWGPFGNGWDFTYYSGHMIEPQYQALIGLPVAWTMATSGPVTGDAILAPVQTAADLDKWKGKLKGKIVLMTPPRELQMATTAMGVRFGDAELANISNEQIPGPPGMFGGRGGRGGRGGANQPEMTPEERRAFQARLRSFYKDEGAAVVVQESFNGDGGTVFGGGANREFTDNPPQVVLAAEHYNRIVRLLEHNVTVKLQFEVKAQFLTDNKDSFNVIAEIPGNARKDELVMVGGHFDSWHYGTGATDNGVGSAVAMEVMRILKTLDLKMDRTVRMGLWGGEEQGLLGSKAYVKEHFADPTVMKPTAEHAKLSGYFNLDNGTGKLRGVYMQGNDMMRPIFESWLAPFKDMSATTITDRNTGGTDHLSFDAVGLPGFQFIQDPMDYSTRTHHSNMDVYDRIQREDLEQMAVIEAAFVHSAATRAEKLPRKPLPPPQPASGRGGRGAAGRN